MKQKKEKIKKKVKRKINANCRKGNYGLWPSESHSYGLWHHTQAPAKLMTQDKVIKVG
jgi:hypothetical protein